MNDNQTKYPQLRFKGFTDPWEKRKLGEVADKVTEKNKTDEYTEVLTNSAEYGIISQSDFFDKEIANVKNLGGYYVVEPDDFVYNPRISNSAPVGPVKRNKLKRIGIMSPLYFVLRPHDIDQGYLEYYFSTKKWHRFMELNGDTGARSDRFAIKDAVFVTMPIPFPNIKEQTKIGTFFATLDHLIAVNQRKLAKLKELKQGYLQKMFPQKGSKFPQLRFAGFADAWEERKLGDILSERNDQMPETNEYPLMSFVQGKGVTPKGERYNRSFLVKDSEKKYKKTELGDFIYSSNNLETGSIGFNKTGKAVISPVYSIFKSKKSRESQFIGIMSARKDFISKMVRFRQGVVYGQWRIHESDFLNIDMKIPNDKEQQLIISFFENIDKTIDLHQRKLEKFQELKQGYLQKMFC
ncbi:restriction endonuclease subunit S (plasmid) [Lactiplantibacillus pentosus]|uniref:restriction endonuclease subunit S n=1 Tax=Lactiplantibacillus pentosus TaxID=1589 RepID=UPI0021C19A0D|nr:restriction endonuclease subunit S [Lactiplantibacillus pentosus]UXI98966.1 restriction endonuclease subunit S [Lactiplantibacillus pentosus]